MGRTIDFSKCYIYHIKSKDGEVHYIGSTSNMNSRRSKHKYNCKTEKCKEYNYDIYRYIRDHGGWDLFEIVPIRKIENVSNKTELRIAEQQEINKFSNLKNKNGSYRSSRSEIDKVYYESNKETIREKNLKRYHEKKELEASYQ